VRSVFPVRPLPLRQTRLWHASTPIELIYFLYFLYYHWLKKVYLKNLRK